MMLSLGAVDDDDEILYTLEAMARSQGWPMIVTTDPFKAIEWVERGMVDLLLVDFHMPEMSGLDLIRQARQLSPSVVLMALTVEQSPELARDLFMAGADDFVSKPVRLADFCARIGLHGELSHYRKAGRWEKSEKGVAESTARMVLDLMLKEGGSLSASDVAGMTGLSYPTAHRYLEYLSRKGQLRKVRRQEDGRNGRPKSYYFPVD